MYSATQGMARKTNYHNEDFKALIGRWKDPEESIIFHQMDDVFLDYYSSGQAVHLSQWIDAPRHNDPPDETKWSLIRRLIKPCKALAFAFKFYNPSRLFQVYPGCKRALAHLEKPASMSELEFVEFLHDVRGMEPLPDKLARLKCNPETSPNPYSLDQMRDRHRIYGPGLYATDLDLVVQGRASSILALVETKRGDGWMKHPATGSRCTWSEALATFYQFRGHRYLADSNQAPYVLMQYDEGHTEFVVYPGNGVAEELIPRPVALTQIEAANLMYRLCGEYLPEVVYDRLSAE